MNMIDEKWECRMREGISLFSIVIDSRGKVLIDWYQMFY